jgi:hypothetical protein
MDTDRDGAFSLSNLARAQPAIPPPTITTSESMELDAEKARQDAKAVGDTSRLLYKRDSFRIELIMLRSPVVLAIILTGLQFNRSRPYKWEDYS